MTKFHYAWIILFMSFAGVLGAQGVRLSFGAFVEPWQQAFGVGRDSISLVSAVSFIVYGVTVPIFGKLTDRFGVTRVFAFSVLFTGLCTIAVGFTSDLWELALVYGVAASIGFGGASGVVATVAVTRWFAAKRGLAYGILEAGFGAGQMIIAPASLLLIHSIGWERTSVYMGLMLIVLCPVLLAFYRSKPSEKGMLPLGGVQAEEPAPSRLEPAKKASTLHILKLRSFWLLFIPFFICGYTTTGLMDTHLIAYCRGAGYSTALTGTAVSVLAAFNIVGCLLSGKIADRWNPAMILTVLYLIRAATLPILFLTFDPVWLLVFSILFGLVDFATVAPTTLLTADLFQTNSLGLVLGLLTLGHQFGSALGAYFPGWLYTQTGNYTLPFLTAAILLVFASLLNLMFPQAVTKKSDLPC
ncbi:MFS transporter [Paenibacillus validus]|nr:MULTISPECIES: MFS transporter [Paenibacillus]MED4602740.1 MFS transporter [Paenibacillus validus]MED4607278.1 MFS transporter [Paenibacillus validus]